MKKARVKVSGKAVKRREPDWQCKTCKKWFYGQRDFPPDDEFHEVCWDCCWISLGHKASAIHPSLVAGSIYQSVKPEIGGEQ
jgi:hypothetical protein